MREPLMGGVVDCDWPKSSRIGCCVSGDVEMFWFVLSLIWPDDTDVRDDNCRLSWGFLRSLLGSVFGPDTKGQLPTFSRLWQPQYIFHCQDGNSCMARCNGRHRIVFCVLGNTGKPWVTFFESSSRACRYRHLEFRLGQASSSVRCYSRLIEKQQDQFAIPEGFLISPIMKFMIR